MVFVKDYMFNYCVLVTTHVKMVIHYTVQYMFPCLSLSLVCKFCCHSVYCFVFSRVPFTFVSPFLILGGGGNEDPPFMKSVLPIYLPTSVLSHIECKILIYGNTQLSLVSLGCVRPN